MTFVPRTASLEQVLRFMKAMAMSPAFTAEMQSLTTANASVVSSVIQDINGVTQSLPLADDPSQPDYRWVPMTFAQVLITQGMRPQAPYPRLELVGTRGSIQRGPLGEEFRTDQNNVRSWIYVVDAVVTDAQSKAEDAERSSLMLCDALERLVSRNAGIVNPTGALGGLVEAIESEGPPVSATGPEAAEGILGGAMVRFHVMALRSI